MFTDDSSNTDSLGGVPLLKLVRSDTLGYQLDGLDKRLDLNLRVLDLIQQCTLLEG